MQTDMFRLRGVPARMLEVLEAMHRDDPDRWVPRRALLTNWWLFDEQEEIHFGRGNLMLTGTNESGKTTVLVALVTLVLDRMYEPRRIDTTGDAIRTVRYYLLGKDSDTPEHPFYREERTGYVALEFERGSSGQFFTVGIGLRASRKWSDHRVIPWSFVVTDNRRIGIDFNLLDRTHSRPLARQELRDVLGKGGQVFDDSQRDREEYQRAVYEGLFGFRTLEEFHHYLDVLHVVRRPKLGEGLTPAKVAEYLMNSLPPIETRPIENASESFTRIDTIEAEIRRMEEQHELAQDIDAAQIKAVEAQARWDAVQYQAALKLRREAERKLEAKETAVTNDKETVRSGKQRQEELGTERARLVGTLTPLEGEYTHHEAFDAQRELEETVALHDREADELTQLRGDKAAAEHSRVNLEEQSRRVQDSWDKLMGEVRSRVGDLAALARNALWPGFAARADAAQLSIATAALGSEAPLAPELALSTTDSEADARLGLIEPVLKAHEELERGKEGHQRIVDSTQRARVEYGKADERYTQSVQAVESAKEAAIEALQEWHDRLEVLDIPAEALNRLQETIIDWDDRSIRPASFFSPVRAGHATQREAINFERDSVVGELSRIEGLAEQTRGQIRGLEQAKLAEMKPTEAQARARAKLRTEGIPFIPLYAAIDFRPDVLPAQDAAHVEEALEASGLLNSLVVPQALVPEVSRLLDDPGLGDQWIRSLAEGAENPWLVPAGATGTVRAEDVAAALRAVGCRMDCDLAAAVDVDGSWRIGSLAGRAAGESHHVRFIGETNRRLERERELGAARDHLELLQAQIGDLTDRREQLTRKLSVLEAEWSAGPALSELHRVGEELALRDTAASQRDEKRKALDAANDAEREARKRVDRLRDALETAIHATGFARDLTSQRAGLVETSLEEIKKQAVELVRDLGRANDLRAQDRSTTAQIRETEERLRRLSPRIQEKAQYVIQLDAEIDTLRERLRVKSRGLEEIGRQIAGLKTRIEEIGTELDGIRSDIMQAETRITVMEPDLDDLRGAVRTATLAVEETEFRFSSRLQSYPAFDGLVRGGVTAGWEPVAFSMTEGVDRSVAEHEAAKAQQELTEKFHAHREAFAGLAPRLDLDSALVHFSHQDGELLACELVRSLESDLATKSAARDAQDREIIEKVFLRDITDTIRNTIHDTQAWVKDVSEILEGMKLFKGGVLRIRLAVRERKLSDAYDPKRLHDLFTKRGIALLAEQQVELVEIFRSMIDDIRRRARDSKQGIEYRSALTEMLDYKQWYDLKIERRDERGYWGELTRKRYGEGSVGRRSMDLILPLIAAVYARLAAAGPAAPRLIGFDEAFAGVDDSNAAQIYSLLSRLGMSWIMATEKATNYGPHVPGAVTYEFINDGTDVAPTASVWDGRVQHTFERDEIEMDKVFVPKELRFD